MPGAPKPKVFTARRNFQTRGRNYRAGDEVTNRYDIDHLVRYGDKYIVATRAKTAKAEQPIADPIGATSEEDS